MVKNLGATRIREDTMTQTRSTKRIWNLNFSNFSGISISRFELQRVGGGLVWDFVETK